MLFSFRKNIFQDRRGADVFFNEYDAFHFLLMNFLRRKAFSLFEQENDMTSSQSLAIFVNEL
ncbi:MAG: hypothetical protein ACI9WT_001159 [Flavobacterium sp.]|jgi:hypothetical protein